MSHSEQVNAAADNQAMNQSQSPKRLAILAILVYGQEEAGKINEILHAYSRWIIGRLGLPYKDRRLSVICIVLDAPNETIGALTGKIGRLPNVNVKALYARENTPDTSE